jgi:hypothetical protein
MTMTTHKVLFQKFGENSGTAPDPVRPYVEGCVDLTKKTTCCLSFDDDRPVEVNLYEVHDVTIPSWMTVEEWISDSIQWKYTWGAGVDPTWPEAWQRGLHRFGTVEARLAAVKLLKTKKFRSDFRKSLHDQLVAWLETPADQRQHRSPFSGRQWEVLLDTYTHREAKRLEENLYRSNRYAPCLGAPVGA